MVSDVGWNAIFDTYQLHKHNFDDSPYYISATQIKDAVGHLPRTSDREVRLLCKQDTRSSRPKVFIEKDLFLLPVKNGHYVILNGEGYVDIPDVTGTTEVYESQLDFTLDTAQVGNSEMQHLDFAYAASLIRTFMNDDSLVLTIRGRKYSPDFSFQVNKHQVNVDSVQTEVDAGYEGRNNVVLVEAKNSKSTNTIIRQLYYPFRQWSYYTNKPISTLFFERQADEYIIWLFAFADIEDYNSIKLIKAHKYKIIGS